MPLYEYQCNARHTLEHYFHTAEAAPPTRPCSQCQREAVRLLPLFNPLQYFSESNGRVIQNLDPGVTIHSPKQHRELMRRKGVEPATDWHVSMRPSTM